MLLPEEKEAFVATNSDPRTDSSGPTLKSARDHPVIILSTTAIAGFLAGFACYPYLGSSPSLVESSPPRETNVEFSKVVAREIETRLNKISLRFTAADKAAKQFYSGYARLRPKDIQSLDGDQLKRNFMRASGPCVSYANLVMAAFVSAYSDQNGVAVDARKSLPSEGWFENSTLQDIGLLDLVSMVARTSNPVSASEFVEDGRNRKLSLIQVAQQIHRSAGISGVGTILQKGNVLQAGQNLMQGVKHLQDMVDDLKRTGTIRACLEIARDEGR